MKGFEEFGLSQEILKTIKKLGFTKPTQIQDISISLVISGKDVIGESATGSGKTLAFGCGVIENVIPGDGLQALIITPTRELAEQVKEDLIKLSDEKKLNILAIYGGVSINMQFHNLPKADVVIATPGRFLDHLRRKKLDTSKIKILVLDEADRMFDMGFVEDVERIIRACPRKRQTLFFSATISSRVKDLAKKHMIEPIIVYAEKMVDPSKLKQVYYDVQKTMKLSLLIHLLQNEKSGLVMVFCNTRNTTDFIAKNLQVNKIKAIAIHGGLMQNKRNKTLELFNTAKVGVLVCTDVASRGLHVENVSHVYNYDLPKDPKDYVHRIGRTARVGKAGKVINILSSSDYDNFSRIRQEYRDFLIEKIERGHIKKIIPRRPIEVRHPQNRRHSTPRNRRR